MSRHPRCRGAALLLALLALVLAMLAALGLEAGSRAAARDRERLTERALAQAREALIAYAADHPVNASVGPGYLPCPDLDNDGWAESTCGSLAGDTGQAQRLGRLPWKTLGIPDLRDGHGERLWYAVSTKYKGLLNCGASRACVDMSPAAALGTITVRDASGAIIHDGTLGDPARAAAGGALAVVLAPGPPTARADGMQRRDCPLSDWDAAAVCVTSPPQRAALCDPANYLEDDNTAFVDRSDAAGRALNADGFTQGPAARAAMNDRLAVIAYEDLMPRIMRRVALEVASCLRFYASRPENAGRMPWMAAACADPASPMEDVARNAQGRLADTPFSATAATGMLPRWWRAQARTPEALAELPTRDDACRIAMPPADAGPVRSAAPGTPADEGATAGSDAPSWWSAWKPYVTVSIAPAFTPLAAAHPACGALACIDVLDTDGHALALARAAVVAVRRRAASCAAPSTCDASGCRVTRSAGDALAWLP